MSIRSSEEGFSLVETLVALAVIATMAGVLFEAISTHAAASQKLEQKREAILLAQSLLAQASVSAGPGRLAETGEWGNLLWHFRRRGMSNGADGGLQLEEVRIDVADRSSRRPLASVRTVRIGR